MKQEGPKLKLLQVPHSDLEGVINVFQALVKADISPDEWRDILVGAEVAGNPDLQDKLHDYFMENGENILTKDDLVSSIETLKQTK